jgi:TatD DNase family protein
MLWIDTHTHFYDTAFDEDRDQAVQRALQNGLRYFLQPSVSMQEYQPMMDFCAKYPEALPMVGLHPCAVGEDYQKQLDFFAQELPKHKFCAVGEIGLDFFHDRTFEKEQVEAFETQISWAKVYCLPVSLHIRKAYDEALKILEKHSPALKGVLHCFGGDLNQAKRAVDMGFKLGIGGVVTFKNATLATILQEIPITHIVLETDAPYLAPVPHRGKRNESAYIPAIALQLCDIYGLNLQEVSEITTRNAVEIFGLSV